MAENSSSCPLSEILTGKNFTKRAREFLQSFGQEYRTMKWEAQETGGKGDQKSWVVRNVFPKFEKEFDTVLTTDLENKIYNFYKNHFKLSKTARSSTSASTSTLSAPHALNWIQMFARDRVKEITDKMTEERERLGLSPRDNLQLWGTVSQQLAAQVSPEVQARYQAMAEDENRR